MTGAGDSLQTRGDQLVRQYQDVIVVTLNYRLGTGPWPQAYVLWPVARGPWPVAHGLSFVTCACGNHGYICGWALAGLPPKGP